MTRSLRLVLASCGLLMMPFAAGCDVWQCWLANSSAFPLNPEFLKPYGMPGQVAAEPIYVAASPDGAYVAVSSYGDGGVLSLVDVNGIGPTHVARLDVGDRPYGLLWLNDASLLVCNEGLAATGGTAPLHLVNLVRGSNDPGDPNYFVRTFGDPNDASYLSEVTSSQIAGPSEAVLIPGTKSVVWVTLRFPAGLFEVNLATGVATASQLLPTLAADPLDEPRGIAITPGGSQAWICNYGSGADHAVALTLARELIAARLNVFRGVAPSNPAIADAEQWLIDNRDPDGQLPYRWPEPTDEPDAQAVADAEAVIADLAEFNEDADCTDANDPNCPLSADQWAMTDPSVWPLEPNADPNDPNSQILVLGDPNEAADYYEYATVLGILNRPIGSNGTVVVYSPQMRQVVGIVTVPPRPRSVAITPDGGLAIVTCSGTDGETGSVVIIGVSAQAIAAQRDLPFVPALVRVDPLGARAYVSAWTGNQMAVINLRGLCSGVDDPMDTRLYTVMDRPAALGNTGSQDFLWSASFTQDFATALDVFEGVWRVE